MNTQTKQNYFLSQPHQPFFLLGVVNAIIMMLIFSLSYKGILSLAIDVKTFHVYSLTFLLFMNVFTGFLFTTFPRFNQSDVISKKYYVNTFLISSLGSVLFVTGSFISTELTVFGMLVTFIAQLLIVLKLHTIYKSGQAPDKKDSFWILNANYFGLFGNVFFMLSLYVPETLNAAINISFYLYIIFLAFSVGQRMIPFFSHSFASKNDNFVKIIFTLFIAKALFASLEI